MSLSALGKWKQNTGHKIYFSREIAAEFMREVSSLIQIIFFMKRTH